MIGPILPILLVCFTSIQAMEAAQVKWIVDGDTLFLENGKTVRYIGINAPEIGHSGKSGEHFGKEAKDFHENLIGKQKILLEFGPEKTDQYGRLLAYVYTQDGEFANRLLLEHGTAYCLYKYPNIKHFDLFLPAQRDAMRQKLGMWPKLDLVAKPLLGNKRSYRFHKPDCTFGRTTRRANRIDFNGLWSAFWHGFAPCKRCFHSGVFTK